MGFLRVKIGVSALGGLVAEGNLWSSMQPDMEFCIILLEEDLPELKV